MQFEGKTDPTFLVDAMLGNIARKLRLMGFDCMYDSQINDDELIKQANKDNRIIISRDCDLIRKSLKIGMRSILLENKDELDQLLEIIKKLKLKKVEISGDNARCPKCNFKTETIKKESVHSKIPKKVLENNEKFWICRNCNKIFWEGSHMINLQKLTSELNEK